MYDKFLVIGILTNASEIVFERFEVIDSVDYFTDAP
jgi:hypothetical protein